MDMSTNAGRWANSLNDVRNETTEVMHRMNKFWPRLHTLYHDFDAVCQQLRDAEQRNVDLQDQLRKMENENRYLNDKLQDAYKELSMGGRSPIVPPGPPPQSGYYPPPPSYPPYGDGPPPPLMKESQPAPLPQMTCTPCGKLLDPAAVQSHFAGPKHKTKLEAYVQCITCGKKSPDAKEAEKHYSTTGHKPKVPEKDKSKKPNNAKKDDSAKKPECVYHCNMCDKKLLAIAIAKDHYNSSGHKKKASTYEPGIYSEAESNCYLCQAPFPTPSHAKQHYDSEKHLNALLKATSISTN